MYDTSDPRSGLASTPSETILSRTGLVAEPQIGRFYETDPQITDKAGRHWLVRARNFLVAYSQTTPNAVLQRQGQVDEYCVLLPRAGAVIAWNGETISVPGFSIAFVPPGDSVVTVPAGGEVVRLFTARNEDLAEVCGNARGYDIPRSHMPAFEPWPVPKDGWRVRHYSLDVPLEEGRFGRIFRCTTLMVNVLDPFEGPRDPSKMSPHHHADFEQVSLALRGTFTHFLRWQWTTDMSDWRDDQALDMGAPSVLVIPPPVIHTTRATGAGSNLLVDLFSPPREDFSKKPGWVLNASDYPMPNGTS